MRKINHETIHPYVEDGIEEFKAGREVTLPEALDQAFQCATAEFVSQVEVLAKEGNLTPSTMAALFSACIGGAFVATENFTDDQEAGIRVHHSNHYKDEDGRKTWQ